MDAFHFRDGALFCEEILADELAALYGTPLYVYSATTLREHYFRLNDAFAAARPLICFSVKCCQNVHILRLLRDAGSGFDVVSGGELHRALLAGAEPGGIVFAGVGKSDAEILEALRAGVGLLNVESESELALLHEISCERKVSFSAALRVNPDVDPGTHRYTTTGRKENKFGVDLDRAREAFRRHPRSSGVLLRGIHLHIGSPVNDLAAYEQSLSCGLGLVMDLRRDGLEIDTLDLGGGFGAHYSGDEAPRAADYARALLPRLGGTGLKLILEPGRSIAANAGILLTRAVHEKTSGDKRFAIVDASMNELIRPALYDAYHFIWPTAAAGMAPFGRGADQPHDGLVAYDVVGPICESSDFLARQRKLPRVKRGDLLAVFTAGAYAMSMASQYNSRPRAAEVLVEGDRHRLIRRRETYDDLTAAELYLD